MSKCAVWDCKGAAMIGSDLCWSHDDLRKKGKLVMTEPQWERIPYVPSAANAPPLMCANWDCERPAAPGSEFCRVHQP